MLISVEGVESGQHHQMLPAKGLFHGDTAGRRLLLLLLPVV